MGKLRTVTGIAPSSWASYLMNGDASGIDDNDKAQADAFVAWLGAAPVGCDYYGFKWTHDATQFGVLGADCETYTALISDEKEGK